LYNASLCSSGVVVAPLAVLAFSTDSERLYRGHGGGRWETVRLLWAA